MPSAAPNPDARVVVTGGSAAYEIRDFLTRASVPFTYLDDEGPAGVAVCTFETGVCLTSPTLEDVARELGLITAPSSGHYDLGIVGAGPAGLAAAVYGASEGLSVLVIDEFAPGGQAGTSSRIENYLGFPEGITGHDLAARAQAQARKFGAEILVLRTVVDGHKEGDVFLATLSDGVPVAATAVLIATGVDWRRLDVDGVDRLMHAGVYYGAAASEAPGVAGKDVFIVGGGNSAGQAAMHFADWARSVTILVRGTGLSASMSAYLTRRIEDAPNVAVQTCTEVARVDGDDWLRELTLRDTRSGRERSVPAHAVFVCIGGRPRTASTRDDDVIVDDHGYLVTGRDLYDHGLGRADPRWSARGREPYPLETSQPGMFAAGDVRHGSTKRVSAAVGEGAMAVPLIHRFLADR
ncbi:MAG TPA: FAD-dependent oxidoreductase [Acidimicrobiales bacterium]